MVAWLKRKLLVDAEMEELREARRLSKAERERTQAEHLERTQRIHKVCRESTQRFNAHASGEG